MQYKCAININICNVQNVMQTVYTHGYYVNVRQTFTPNTGGQLQHRGSGIGCNIFFKKALTFTAFCCWFWHGDAVFTYCMNASVTVWLFPCVGPEMNW